MMMICKRNFRRLVLTPDGRVGGYLILMRRIPIKTLHRHCDVFIGVDLI
jgi:hypothetical protein